ncbi:MAG: hypothetical protein ABH883_00630 [Candidatus Omnitrophota bacterium]
MKFGELYKILERNRYYIFTYEDIALFFPDENKDNLKITMQRWRKKGWVCSLKRGLHELTFPEDLVIPDMYVAGKLYTPSYVSLETALSNYSIIPEVSMSVTSITTKPTRRFKNKHGLFTYRTVKPDAFTGYYVEKIQGFDIFMAEPEKAIIDYIYFKAYRNKKFSLKEERLEKDVIAGLDMKKMDKYAKLYNIDLKGFYACL